MKVPIVIVSAAIVAVMATGCATSPPSPIVPTESASVSAAPTPEPTVDPAAVVPFGADCANALTLDEVNALRPASEFNKGPTGRGSAAVEAAGGIECIWMGKIGVHLYAVPASTAAAAGLPMEATAGCDEGTGTCGASSVVDGLWLEVRTGTESGVPQDALLTMSQTLFDTAAERATHWPTATPDARSGRWVAPDCSAVADSIDLVGLFGEFTPGVGRDFGGISPVEKILVDAAQMTFCEWSRIAFSETPATSWIEVMVAPGAGGLASTLIPRQVAVEVPTTMPVEVAGAVETGAWAIGSGVAGAIVSDGVNRVEILVFGDAPVDPTPLASGVFAALAAAG